MNRLHCQRADLMLVLGSSLSVPTACDLPGDFVEDKPEAKLVIVNLQVRSLPPQHSKAIFIASTENT